MYVFAIVVASHKYLGVGFINGGFLGKFILQVVEHCLDRTVKQPAHKSESKYVSALHHGFVVKT